jgi:copper homeostasis protein
MERPGSRTAIGAQPIVIEAAVESLQGALTAEADGANRLELCANLDVGGTTPSATLVAEVLAKTKLPVFMMIRPRSGGFVYTGDEIAAMTRDVEHARSSGVAGIVTGVLTRDGCVDVHRTADLVAAADGLPVTFHRAVDSTANLSDALEQLIQLGVARILTSGGAPTALEGAFVISRMVVQARDRAAVVAGGGIRENNVREVIERTGVREVHSRLVRGVPRAINA